MLHQRSYKVLFMCSLSFFFEIVQTNRRDYNGFSVLRCHPESVQQVDDLRTLMLQTNNSDKVQFWTEPVGLNRSVDMLVDPEYRDTLEAKLDNWCVNCKTLITNLSDAIKQSSPTSTLTRTQLFNSTTRAQYLSAGQYYQQFNRYNDIEAKLRELASKDSRMTMQVIGKSSEGRNLYLVRISSDPAANKPVILLDAGHHAREWITHSTIIYVIESILNEGVPRMSARLCSNDECRQRVAMKVKLNLDDYDYWFVPVVNPDGYEYTHTNDRLWRKTRSRYNNCIGVDPNRNYPIHWDLTGTSRSSCSPTSPGPKAESEPEVRAMVSLINKFKHRILMYITFHSYSQVVFTPYGYTKLYPRNYGELERVAKAWVKSVAELRKTSFRFGTVANRINLVGGSSLDYAYAANMKYAFAIELPDTGTKGFILPPSEIIPVGHETVIGLSAMVETVKQLSPR